MGEQAQGQPEIRGRGRRAVVHLLVVLIALAIGAALLMHYVVRPVQQVTRQMRALDSLRYIGIAVFVWEADHKDPERPDDEPTPNHVWQLVEEDQLRDDESVGIEGSVRLISSPFRKDWPADFATWPVERRREWVYAHCAFVLVPGPVGESASGHIRVFGKPDYFDKGLPVGYGDGHAEWKAAEELPAIERQIEAQTGKTMQTLIEESERLPEGER